MSSSRGVAPGPAQALDLLQHLLLPAVVLALPIAAIQTRILRVSLIDALSAEYVRTARAKGLPDNLVVFRHALRNALLPLITVIALEIPTLFTGAVLVETVFSWPGLGRLLFDSIGARDYPVVEAMLLFVTISVITANWLADLLYGRLDPRIQRA
jgi:peptide/nickel transport system permease protein